MNRIRLAAVVAVSALTLVACTPSADDPTPDTTTEDTATVDNADADAPEETEEPEVETVQFDTELCEPLTTFLNPNGIQDNLDERIAAADQLSETYPETTFAAWGDAWETLRPAVETDATEEVEERDAAIKGFVAVINPLVAEPIAADIADSATGTCDLDERQTTMLAVAADLNPTDGNTDDGLVRQATAAVLGTFGDVDAFLAGEVVPDDAQEDAIEQFTDEQFNVREQTYITLNAGPFYWSELVIPNPNFPQYGYAIVRGQPSTTESDLYGEPFHGDDSSGYVEASQPVQNAFGAPNIGSLSRYDEDTNTSLMAWYLSLEGREDQAEFEGEDPPRPELVYLFLAGQHSPQ